jgi:CHAD domain-containing protein
LPQISRILPGRRAFSAPDLRGGAALSRDGKSGTQARMPEASSRSDVAETNAARVVASAVRLHWRRSQSELAKFGAHGNGAHAHALRVSLRRLLSALELAAAFDTPAPSKLLRRLERTLRSLSPLRDLEVEKKTLQAMSEHAPELTEIAAELEHERAVLARSLSKKLRAFKTAETELGLERTAERLEREALTPQAAKLIALARVARAYAKFDQRRRAVSGGDPHALHRARIAFKQYRYVVEAAMPLLPARAARDLMLMKQLQDELGAIQDTSVLLETLRRLRPFRRRGGTERGRSLLAALERDQKLRVQSMAGVLAAQAGANPPAFSETFGLVRFGAAR